MKCKHQAGWWADEVLIWGDSKGIYIEGRNHSRKRRQRGKVLLTCNMQGCRATRNAYFDVPIPVNLGLVSKATKS